MQWSNVEEDLCASPPKWRWCVVFDEASVRAAMGFTRERLVATFAEAEALSIQIRQMERDSEVQKAAIYRWAVLGDDSG